MTCPQCHTPIEVDSDTLSESVPGHHEWRAVGERYTATCKCTTVTREYSGDDCLPWKREAAVLALHAEAAQENAEEGAA